MGLEISGQGYTEGTFAANNIQRRFHSFSNEMIFICFITVWTVSGCMAFLSTVQTVSKKEGFKTIRELIWGIFLGQIRPWLKAMGSFLREKFSMSTGRHNCLRLTIFTLFPFIPATPISLQSSDLTIFLTISAPCKVKIWLSCGKCLWRSYIALISFALSPVSALFPFTPASPICLQSFPADLHWYLSKSQL